MSEEEVWVVGCKTPLRGRVAAVSIRHLQIAFGEGKRYGFKELFEITTGAWSPEDTAGVSGALVITFDGTVLGMAFAGTILGEGANHLYAFPLGPALSELECEPIFFKSWRLNSKATGLLGVKPGLPPWGPHVRFRRVQTLVREGSPLVKRRNSA